MLGDVVELTVVVRDIEAAIERFTSLFGLKVHHRGSGRSSCRRSRTASCRSRSG